MFEAKKRPTIRELRKEYSTEGVFKDITYGCPIASKGFKHAVSMCQKWSYRIDPKARILVVGAGPGYELVVFYKYGYECYGIDLYIPDVKAVKERSVFASANAMPFKNREFDLVFCTEMMEHVPEETTDDILNECRRVAKRFYFTIATVMDTGYDTHINLHPGYFWIKKFGKLGFKIIHAQVVPIVYVALGGTNLVKYPSQNAGVCIYGLC